MSIQNHRLYETYIRRYKTHRTMTKIVWKSLLKEMIKNTINSQTGACININQWCQRVTRRRPRQRHFREKKQRATRIKSCTGSVRNDDGIQVNIRQYFCNHFTNVSNIVNFLTQTRCDDQDNKGLDQDWDQIVKIPPQDCLEARQFWGTQHYWLT